MSNKLQKIIFFFLFGSIFNGCSLAPSMTRHADPLSAEEHIALGTAYDQQQKKEEALQNYKAAVRIQSTSVAAWMTLGNAYFERKDFKPAEQCYRRVLKLVPHDPGASNNLAMVYLERNKNLKMADHLLNEALRQPGTMRPYILDTLVNVYRVEGRYSDAFSVLHEAEVAAPSGDPAFLTQLAISRDRLLQESKKNL